MTRNYKYQLGHIPVLSITCMFFSSKVVPELNAGQILHSIPGEMEISIINKTWHLRCF